MSAEEGMSAKRRVQVVSGLHALPPSRWAIEFREGSRIELWRVGNRRLFGCGCIALLRE